MTTDSNSPNPIDLSDRVAVVVGAASEIGAASAHALAAAGAHIALGDANEGGLAETARRLGEAGASVIAQPTDVTRRDQVEALVQRSLSEYGRLDVMANLAGVIHDSLVVDTHEDDLDRILAVNLKGVYFGCQAAVAAMTGRGSGSIINMASSGAFLPIPQLSCYSISKAGVVALTRVLAAEVGPLGLRVNAIAPGFIEGGMTLRHVRNEDGRVDAQDRERVGEKARKRNPLRTTGLPEDVGNMVAFLASDASRYMTGQTLHLNGGSHMP